jgi:DNA-directed RNA polymerase subunit RPC12/RpoP
MYMDERETYRCEVCGKEFDSEQALQAHVRSVGLVD